MGTFYGYFLSVSISTETFILFYFILHIIILINLQYSQTKTDLIPKIKTIFSLWSLLSVRFYYLLLALFCSHALENFTALLEANAPLLCGEPKDNTFSDINVRHSRNVESVPRRSAYKVSHYPKWWCMITYFSMSDRALWWCDKTALVHWLVVYFMVILTCT